MYRATPRSVWCGGGMYVLCECVGNRGGRDHLAGCVPSHVQAFSDLWEMIHRHRVDGRGEKENHLYILDQAQGDSIETAC